MFNVYLYEQGKSLPEDDICYLIGKQGVFIKKKLGLIESLTPVNQISVLDDVTPYAKLSIPKIPAKLFVKILQFFRDVYHVHRSECAGLIFYREKDHDFRFYAPEQKVSYASVEYVRGHVIPDYLCIGSIHSHSGFSAFHSGIDKSDEEHFDGIHFTSGYLDKEISDIVGSIAINGHRVPIDCKDYVEGLDIVEYTNFSTTMFTPSFTLDAEGKKEYTKDVVSHTGFTLSGITEEDKLYPEYWFDRVTKDTPTYVYTSGQGVGTGGQTANLIEWWKRNSSGRTYPFSGGTTGGGSKVDNKTNPCYNCVFSKKNRKSRKKREGLQNNYEDIDQWNLYNFYPYI